MHDLTLHTTGELKGLLSDTLREAAIARALVAKLDKRAGEYWGEIKRRKTEATQPEQAS